MAEEQATSEAPTPEAPAPEPKDEKEAAFVYPVKVEEAGPGTRKVTVDIPQERIAEKLAEQFKELRQQAALPGFRPGHAPQKLVERRFAQDVREQVRRSLVSESYEQALEKNSLQVIGEPEFESQDTPLPTTGPLQYSFTVEVQPSIKLPELKGLKVKKPHIEITDQNVDQALANLRQQQGSLLPVEGRGVEDGDMVIADVHLTLDGVVVQHAHDETIPAKPGRVMGIAVDDLEKQLAGAKPGEKRTLKAKAPETHELEAVRGKDVEIEIAIKEIKRLELAEINAEFLGSLGFANETELRDALREQMVERVGDDVQEGLRQQVNKYLLENVEVELPAKLSERQTDRLVSRRRAELMLRGLPREQVEARTEALATGAKEDAAKELKLFFILQQVAAAIKVDVSEAELNQRISIVALQRGRRPEKMKQDMAKDGTLANLYVQMREHKALDAIIAQAQIEEVPLADAPATPA